MHVVQAVVLAALCSAGPAAMAQQVRPAVRPASLAVPPAAVADPVSAPAPEAEPEVTAPAEPDPIPVSATGPQLGPETNLPLPRYVSLKTDQGNVRRGPSLTHRIDWVFLRRDMPLQVVAEYGHWRRVIDREGVGGWVHYALISGTRTVIVDEDMLRIRARPSEAAPANAAVEAGVIARLGECNPDWCRISAGGYRGWAPKAALWGVDPHEIRE